MVMLLSEGLSALRGVVGCPALFDRLARRSAIGQAHTAAVAPPLGTAMVRHTAANYALQRDN